MARFTVDFYSNSLRRPVQFKIFIPNDFSNEWKPEQKSKKMRTIFLLHGYRCGPENWVGENLATLYNFALVMPNGENGFYLNGLSSGHDYETFVGVELVDYVRKTFGLAKSPDETFVMGFSMGGFGALHTAFAYPETFGKTVALSSALIIHSTSKMKKGEDNGMANYDYYRECFGELGNLENSRNNPEILIEEILKNKKRMPKIFMACGEQDFLLEENRSFHKFLSEKNVPHIYLESPGGHDFTFWDEYVKKFLPMLIDER